MEFLQVLSEFEWFFSLGAVVIISTLLTMLLVEVIKKVALKKFLSTSTDSQIDKVLGLIGTITSLIIYTIVYFASEMIIQGKFMIDFKGALSAVSIPSGAAVTWVSAKGLYTVWHKWWNRLKDKKVSKADAKELAEDINTVKTEVQNAVPINSEDVVNEISEVTGIKIKKIL